MLDLKRRDDWPERLIGTLDAHRSQPFAWGHYDCATLFAAAVEAVTGVDPIGAYRPTKGTWKSKRSALYWIRHAGFTDMVNLTTALFPRIHPVAAQRGDLVFGVVSSRIVSPAICVGAEMVTRDLALGWVVMPMAQATMAFKVG